jgi:hypothetical protein
LLSATGRERREGFPSSPTCRLHLPLTQRCVRILWIGSGGTKL